MNETRCDFCAGIADVDDDFVSFELTSQRDDRIVLIGKLSVMVNGKQGKKPGKICRRCADDFFRSGWQQVKVDVSTLETTVQT